MPSHLIKKMSNNTPLGKSIAQPLTYSPQSLASISRSIARKVLPEDKLAQMRGYDVWTFWECSWLDDNGVAQQAVVQMIVPADSPFIVESKSLKLYLNSLNNHCVGEKEDLFQLLKTDLTPVLGIEPLFKVVSQDALQRHNPQGDCVDDYRSQISSVFSHSTRLQAFAQENKQTQPRSLYSHLFRSLCPVTAQPDFASVYVHNFSINPKSLLSYWLSFRNHQGFHEQCIEQMFCDFYAYAKQHNGDEKLLKVGGAFTRRGGIDIHPIRYHQKSGYKITDPIQYTLMQ
jgi:7-cyano-7-deazaguanine reductase